MGNTIAARTERIKISKKPNSVPEGICPTTYGSRKIYSETNKRENENPVKIIPAKIIYRKFEKTSLKVEFILNHRINYVFKN